MATDLTNEYPWSELLKPNCGVQVTVHGHSETDFHIDDVCQAAEKAGLDVDTAERLALDTMGGVGCSHCGEGIDTVWIEKCQKVLRRFLKKGVNQP